LLHKTGMDDQKTLPLPPGSTRASAPRNRILPWVFMLIGLAGVVLLVVRLRTDTKPSGRGFNLPPQAVGVATAAASNMLVSDSGLGTVTSLATVTVQTQISGVMQQVGFQEGQVVRKGDFLAQIDPRPYEALLQQAKGTLAHDQGLLAQARIDLARYARLNRQDSIGRQTYEDQVYVVQQYEGSVAADQGAVETQNVNLAFCHITAPIAGRVGLRQVDPGNYITPALANGLVVITQLDPISVIFTLPEDEVPPIQAQLRAGAKLQVIAYDRANTTQLATGTLETIDNQIDTTTGTIKLRALFANPDCKLFPNQFINVKLIVSTVHGALTVPNAAIQTGAPGSFVYAIQPDSTVAVVPVKLGVADEAKTQITDGLSAGQQIVVDGADRLRDGAKVTLPGPPPANSGQHWQHKPGEHPWAGHRHHREAAPDAN
jgi:multidrug efflux system membrane fusion protein